MKSPKPLIKLTRKQKNFADLLIENPKMSATEAVNQTYNVANRHTAEVIASENLRKPELQIYMQEHVDLAKRRIVELTSDEKSDIALRASQDILDRSLGKARQQIEVQSTSLNINISLSDLQPE